MTIYVGARVLFEYGSIRKHGIVEELWKPEYPNTLREHALIRWEGYDTSNQWVLIKHLREE